MMHQGQWTHFFITLFAITNPFGNLVIFIALVKGRSTAEQRRCVGVMCVAIAVVMLLSLWCGDVILNAFGISLGAFEAAGGLVILLIGLSMLQAKKTAMSHSEQEQDHAQQKESIAVVPLAIPLLAGPGTMASIIIASKHSVLVTDKCYFSLACLLVTFLIGIIFLFSAPVAKLLGPSGLKIVTRVMGLILMAMAVTMLSDAALLLFPAWG